MHHINGRFSVSMVGPPQQDRGILQYQEALDDEQDILCEGLEDGHLENIEFEASQLGITKWTAAEKELLFQALARRGRHDIRGIANALQSKSEVEVSAYCNLLEETLKNIYIEGDPDGWLLRQEDIPAAYEISQDCCEALDEAATVIEDSEDSKISPPVLPSDILKRNGFHNLSQDLFMNSQNPDYHGHSYSPRYTPWIHVNALNQLETRIISLTRRLMSTAILLAASRIRVSTRPDRTPRSLVRTDDIEGAAKILGLKPNSQEYWVTLARRQNLAVLGEPSEDDPEGKELRLRDVERRLRRPGNARTIDEDMEIDSAESSFPDSSDEDNDEADVPVNPASEYVAAAKASSNDLRVTDEDDLLDLQLEYLDTKASYEEELRLWRTLGRDSPERIRWLRDQLGEPLEEIPREQVTWNEQRDWRDHTDITPSWVMQNLVKDPD